MAGGQQYPKGALYLIATPIGNLADITLRAVQALTLADVVACEDTRVTGGFLRHLGMDKRLVPLHLQGRIASVNMVGIFAGLVIGQLLGGLIAEAWGLTAPWWFAFGGAAITLLFMWRSISLIAAAKPEIDDPREPDTRAQ